MKGINKVILVGYVASEPKFSNYADNQVVGHINLCTPDYYINNNGQKVSLTCYHRLTVWGKLAQSFQKYVHQGKNLYVEGRINNGKFTDKSGVDKYYTEIVVSDFALLNDNGEERKGKVTQPQNTQNYNHNNGYSNTRAGNQTAYVSSGNVTNRYSNNQYNQGYNRYGNGVQNQGAQYGATNANAPYPINNDHVPNANTKVNQGSPVNNNGTLPF